MTGGNSSSAPSLKVHPTWSGGWSLVPAAAKNRVRPASKPYQGHWKLSVSFGRGFGAAAVVVGWVNCRLGCDTLPGAFEST